MRKRTLSREFAIQMLYQQELNPQPVSELCSNFWERFPEAKEDVREFAEKLVVRTLENQNRLDEIIRKAIENWDMQRVVLLDKNIMRLAVCEFFYFEDIPPKVAINEAVNLAKKFSQEESGKFVNGVLDRICHSEKIRYQEPLGDDASDA